MEPNKKNRKSYQKNQLNTGWKNILKLAVFLYERKVKLFVHINLSSRK